MHVRNTWLLEDLRSFDEPADGSAAPELTTLVRHEWHGEEDEGFRALLDDPEACWMAVNT
jgi:hypothetical protein